uniref:Uncharacterized protein n=1 Tax=Megaselia scalaris TaxID=36166 RepID=T1H1I8_MEGSC
DVKRFGVLDNFSCFPFENKLGEIKNCLRSGNLPLEQIAKRIGESFYDDIFKQSRNLNEENTTTQIAGLSQKKNKFINSKTPKKYMGTFLNIFSSDGVIDDVSSEISTSEIYGKMFRLKKDNTFEL